MADINFYFVSLLALLLTIQTNSSKSESNPEESEGYIIHYPNTIDLRLSEGPTDPEGYFGNVDVTKLIRPGEYGKPVLTNNLTQEEELYKENLYNKYGYNQFVSELISTHRSLPDFRDPW